MTTLPAIGTRVRDLRRPAYPPDNRGEGVVVAVGAHTDLRFVRVKVRWDQRTGGRFQHTWVSPSNLEVVE